MADGEDRVVEVVAFFVCHTDLLHHAARTDVGGHREGNNLRQSQFLKAERHSRLGTFGAIALPPEFGSEPPANFDARRERGLKARTIQANETGEGCNSGNFYRPQPETMFLKV